MAARFDAIRAGTRFSRSHRIERMRLTAHAREVIRNATREVFGADAHHSATASSTNT
jgi:hypothetical protein